MLRRKFMQNLAAVGGSALMAGTFLPGRALASSSPVTAINYQSLFKQALAKNPLLIGFANIEHNFAKQQLEIEGKLPAALKGHFYRNGPAKHERGDVRYQHLFEGDGMLQKFHLDGEQISHQGRFVETPKFNQEQKAQKFLFSGPDTKLANALPAHNADEVNTANTNIIAVGADLWALWEAGSATRIDPDNLDYQGQVNLGQGSHYGNSLKGLPFSAHPKVDPSGDIWNFGLNPSGHLVLYHLSASGKVKNVKLINAKYRGGMLHDFLITDKSLLLILPSLVSNRASGAGMFSSIEFASQQPMRVLVVNKSDLSLRQEFELAPGFSFHFGNAWEESNGTIHFDASLYPNIDRLFKHARAMQGDTSKRDVHARTAFYTLYKSGQVKQQLLDDISEFPRVSNHKVGLRNDYLYRLSSNVGSLWHNQVSALNTHTGKEDKYAYGQEFLVEEHVPVNPNNKEGEGYLMGTALHVPSKRTCLNIFELDNISAGPICRAWLNHHLPLGFHGNFVPA